MQNELEKIQERYAKRAYSELVKKQQSNWVFNYYIQVEREFIYSQILRKSSKKISNIKLIEIGAGTGNNLLFFHRLGIPFNNIVGNELLEDRAKFLKQNIEAIHVDIGDATELSYNEEFDIVFQSTVFTSILDTEIKEKLATKMWEMTKKDGFILWYDFKYNNPSNKDVKGVGKSEIRELFPNNKGIDFYNVTLAPPIGRLIGKAYNIVNFLFPFLRTHLLAVIKK